MNMQPILLELQAPGPSIDKDYGTTIQHEKLQFITINDLRRISQKISMILAEGR